MTLDEARKVAAVGQTADGGCSHCVRGIIDELNEKFPEFVLIFRERESGEDGPRIEVESRTGT